MFSYFIFILINNLYSSCLSSLYFFFFFFLAFCAIQSLSCAFFVFSTTLFSFSASLPTSISSSISFILIVICLSLLISLSFYIIIFFFSIFISTLFSFFCLLSFVFCLRFPGSGFFTHHLSLTNIFEASLRSINPAVTLPYWDFTIEGQAIQNLNENPSYMLQITPVFTDTWFGSTDEFHHINNSRWAHSLMPKQPDVLKGVKNSYGYIRSYWNNNPDPGVSIYL